MKSLLKKSKFFKTKYGDCFLYSEIASVKRCFDDCHIATLRVTTKQGETFDLYLDDYERMQKIIYKELE